LVERHNILHEYLIQIAAARVRSPGERFSLVLFIEYSIIHEKDSPFNKNRVSRPARF
jgi:hypothetical protein